MGRHMAEINPVEAVREVSRAVPMLSKPQRSESSAGRRDANAPAEPEENGKDTREAGAQTHVGFSIHKETGTVVIKVIDNVSREVLRQVPPEEQLKLAVRLRKTIGLLFEKIV